MNKTVNINLAGIFFHIDEDAYLKLQRYLEAIKRSFTDSQGRAEIISDIEARIAELFNERIQNDKQVVGTKLVDEVITIMGQPEDYLVDDEIFEDDTTYTSKKESKSTANKTLFRDTENSYIGGVAAGLSHYLGIDMIWVRLLWILLTFFSGGTFIIIYILCWALIPEAITTAEKLRMSGEPINISNIEKKIKDSLDIVSEKIKNVDFKKHTENVKEGIENVADNITETVKSVDFEKKSDQLKDKSRSFFETIGNLVMLILNIFGKFFGIILIIIGVSTLLTLIVGFLTVGVTEIIQIPGMDFIEISNTSSTPIWLISLLLFFAFGIPFFFLLYLGLRILVSNLKSIGNTAKFSLLALWVISLLSFAVIGIKQATNYNYNAYDTSKKELNISKNDTLKIIMSNNFEASKRAYINNGGIKIYKDKNGKKTIASSDIKFIVRSTKKTTAKIELSKKAYGNNYDDATDRAENISYNYNFENNVLSLDKYLTTNATNKFSGQTVQLIIYLPEGTTLLADKNTYRYHRNPASTNDILKNGMEEKYLKIIKDDVVCLSCENETSDKASSETIEKVTDDTTNNGVSIDENGIEINTKTNAVVVTKDGISTKNNDVKVKIDENGVNITTKKDNN